MVRNWLEKWHSPALAEDLALGARAGPRFRSILGAFSAEAWYFLEALDDFRVPSTVGYHRLVVGCSTVDEFGMSTVEELLRKPFDIPLEHSALTSRRVD